MRLPRKRKKLFKSKVLVWKDKNWLASYNWYFHNRMVIVRNYTLANISFTPTKEDQNYIKTGLLTNDQFNTPYIY